MLFTKPKFTESGKPDILNRALRGPRKKISIYQDGTVFLNKRSMFEGTANCFSVYQNYSVIERLQNLISEAVISQLMNAHS